MGDSPHERGERSRHTRHSHTSRGRSRRKSASFHLHHLSTGRELRKRDIPLVAMVCAGLVVGMCFLVFLLRKVDEKRLAVSPDEEEAQTSSLEDEERWLTVDGVTYHPKPSVRTYLFMGIDETGSVYAHPLYYDAGQADTLIVCVVDQKEDTVQLLQIDRDTMAYVPVLTSAYNLYTYERWQICLAHGFGDGLDVSCANQALAVSIFLNNQPIDGYLSLNIDSVGIVNDMAGGVTLEVLSDFGEDDPGLVKGETVTLTGEQAIHYVRGRKSVGDGTNADRMIRQRQFLTALKDAVKMKDAEWVLNVYDALTPYMVTNMGSGTIVDLYDLMEKQTETPILTMEGTHQIVDDLMTFEVDSDSWEQMLLKLFYEPVEE